MNGRKTDSTQGNYAPRHCDKLLLLAHVADDYGNDNSISRNHRPQQEFLSVNEKERGKTNVTRNLKEQTESSSEKIFNSSEPKSVESIRKQRIVRTATFAMKLMSVLINKSYAHVISWFDNGKSFIILNQDAFTRYVLPNEFKTAKYESFTRKLYRWGFRRVANSEKDRAFFHPLFLRNDPHLCRQMRSGNLVNEKDVIGCNLFISTRC